MPSARLFATVLTLAALLAGCGATPKPPCASDADCADDNPCTDDRCEPGVGCAHTNNTGSCDDGDACTEADTCALGRCGGSPVSCDDSNGCTDDRCDPATGCLHQDNTAACDDGDACTLGDACAAGRCQPGSDTPDCDDGNGCTDDRCEPATGCVHQDNAAACDDGDACTEADTCALGQCGGLPVSCDDSNGCTDDRCEPAIGCTHQNNTAACDDGDACTLGDACAAGRCQPGPDTADCDDGNGCTDDRCEPATGCLHQDNTAPCDDGDVCTLGDTCAGDACQPGASALDCDDADACTRDGCDPDAGCFHSDASGACDDADACTRDWCDPATGCRHLPCAAWAACTGGACRCLTGYSGDGFACEPVCGDGLCPAGETLNGCPQDCDYTLLVIVSQALLPGLQASLDQYLADLAQEGTRAYLRTWTGGSAASLRALLAAEAGEHAIEGALLVGDLPAAWYQQTAFNTYEEFPCDLPFMDLDATFSDNNHDGIFDGHSPLALDIFVSRIIGTQAELTAYFGKIHAYRQAGSGVPVAGFIFMDDDWSNFPGRYGLEYIYTTVEILNDPAATSKAAYLQRLLPGVEFVFQWIHSTPTYLHIYGAGEGYIDTAEVVAENHQGAFYNLFNCSAARFTEPNLARAYLMGTDRGLALTGTTKVGGMVTPRLFHQSLGDGHAFGESFRRWYNGNGATDDAWFLGMVIQGDPMLRIAGDVVGRAPPSREEEISAQGWERLEQLMQEAARHNPVRGFAEYRAEHPESFPAAASGGDGL